MLTNLLTITVFVLTSLVLIIYIPHLYASSIPQGSSILQLQNNNFTLTYGESGLMIEPTSFQAIYNSGTNNLTTVSCGTVLMGGCISSTKTITNENENKLINVISDGNLFFDGFNSDRCSSPACTPSHLTISIPNLNLTNTLSWTSESLETLDGLNTMKNEIGSIT